MVPIRRDVPWWVPFCEPCVSYQSPASTELGRPSLFADMGRETVYGRPEDRRSRSGHIGNTRRRQLEREVVMKYLRYKFCEILCSVCVFSNRNNQHPLKNKKKKL